MSARFLFCLAGLFAFADAWPAAFGPARGPLLIGGDLQLEIAVDEAPQERISRECLRLETHSTDRPGQYLPPRAVLDVRREGDRAVVVVTGGAIAEPVVAFTLGCGQGVRREYLMLADLPVPALPEATTEAPAAPRQATKRTAADVRPAVVRAQGETNLLLISRQRYPDSPRTREKFIRMMLQANPELGSRHTPIAATADLAYPEDLPPLPAERKVATAAPAAARSPTVPRAVPQPAPAKPRDQLVIGSTPVGPDADIAAELVQIIPLMKEQNQTQLAMIAKLARLEAEFTALQQRYEALEQRPPATPAPPPPPVAEKRAPEPAPASGLIELLLAMFAGGALGGGGLLLRQKLAMRRRAVTAPAASVAPAAMAVAATRPAAPAPVPAAPVPAAPAPVAAVPAAPPAKPAPPATDDAHLHIFDFPLGQLPSDRPENAGADGQLDFSVQGPARRPG